MFIALMMLMLLLSMIGMTVMHYSVLWGILVCLCAGVLTVLYLVLLKKLPSVLKNGIMWGGFLLCLVFFVMMKPQTSGYQLTGYMEDMIKVEKIINRGDKKAEKTLDKMKDKYGETDAIKGLYASLCLSDEDLEGAYGYMNRYSDRSSREYYLLSAIALDDQDEMEYYYLGAVYFEKGHFDDCKKYFYKALECGVSDEVKSWIAWYVERME